MEKLKILATVSLFLGFICSTANAEQVSCTLNGTRVGYNVKIDLTKVTCNFDTSQRQDIPIPVPVNKEKTSLEIAREIMMEKNTEIIKKYVIKSGESIASVLGSNSEAKKALNDMNISYSSNEKYSIIPNRTIQPGFTFYKVSNGISYWYEKGAE